MEENRLKAEYLLKGLSKLGCKTFNLGMRDFAAGEEYLLNLQKKADVDFVSANVVYNDTKDHFVEPFVIRDKDQKPLKIGIMGLCQPGDRLVPGQPESKKLISKPLAESIEKPLKKLSKKADIIILLYHGTYNDLMELLEQNINIDVVVLGGQYYRVNQYEREKPILVSTPPLGKYLSKLELVLDEKKNIVTHRKERFPLDENIENDPAMQELIRQYNKER